MNIQTERLDNHIARLTVEVDESIWEEAKQKAARDLAKRYRIPGFRKGKAPYSVVLRYLGEAPIMESAIERLGNDVYKDVLKQAEINPYAAGSMEDFKLEPKPTYIFTVPLQPEAELGDYRAVRLEYVEPTVTDEQVNQELRRLQQSEAVVEDSVNPVRVGDRVTVDIHSEFVDDAPESAADAENPPPPKGAEFVHHHDAVLNLDPQIEPVLPGFIDAMVGAVAGEEREFELTVPADNEDYKDIAGRKVHFHATAKKVQNVTLPELTDDLAARITQDEDEPLTLLQLRIRARQNLQEDANRKAHDEYGNRVLDKIAEQATVAFPDAMVDDRIHEMIHDFDKSLRQQGITLETYQKVMGVTHEQLHEEYHDSAISSLKRSLVMGELMNAEGIQVRDEDVTAEIEKTLSQFGEQAASFRKFLDTPQQRQNIATNILYERMMKRLAKIGKGEPLDEDEPTTSPTEAGEAPTPIAETPVAESESAVHPVTDNQETE